MAAAEGDDNAAEQHYQWTSDGSGESGDSLFFGPFSGKSRSSSGGGAAKSGECARLGAFQEHTPR
eukprot:1631985-Prymnesium_polylepis.1